MDGEYAKGLMEKDIENGIYLLEVNCKEDYGILIKSKIVNPTYKQLYKFIPEIAGLNIDDVIDLTDCLDYICDSYNIENYKDWKVLEN